MPCGRREKACKRGVLFRGFTGSFGGTLSLWPCPEGAEKTDPCELWWGGPPSQGNSCPHTPSKQASSRERERRISLRGSSDKIGTIQTRLARPMRQDDTHKSRRVLRFLTVQACKQRGCPLKPGRRREKAVLSPPPPSRKKEGRAGEERRNVCVSVKQHELALKTELCTGSCKHVRHQCWFAASVFKDSGGALSFQLDAWTAMTIRMTG